MEVSSGNLNFGIVAGSSGTPNYSIANYSISTTYLIVIKYTFDATTSSASLFINPSLYSEPSIPDAIHSETGLTNTNIGSVALRQFNSSQNLLIDGIRIGTNWGAVLGLQYNASSNIAAGNYNDVSVLSNTLSIDGDVSVNGTIANSGNIAIGENTLSINGAISGSGTYTGGATSNISVGGTGANLNFPNISGGLNKSTISRPNGINLGATSALTVSGTLANTGTLTIKSDATGTGSLIHNTNNTATTERYIPGSTNNWHLLSSPVAAQVITNGNFTDANGYDFEHVVGRR